MFVHSSKALLFSGFGFDQHMQKELIAFLCTKLQGCRCLSAPFGSRQGPGQWPRGTRNDWTTTKQPRAQSSARREKRKTGSKQTPVLKDPEKKDVAFAFTKGKFSYMFLLLFLIKTFIKMGKITSSSHDCFSLLQPPNPLTCSSWEAFPQNTHIVVLKKIKVRWNQNVLLQANTRLHVCDWMDKARNG